MFRETKMNKNEQIIHLFFGTAPDTMDILRPLFYIIYLTRSEIAVARKSKPGNERRTRQAEGYCPYRLRYSWSGYEKPFFLATTIC